MSREQLEEKLHDLILLRGESAEIAMWRKHLSTSDRVKVDKRNHELGLWLLDSLPKATMKEVLQTVCRELDINEISEIQPSLAKLKAVVKTVPRMERFISQVCNFIYQRHPSLGEIDGMKTSATVASGGVAGAEGGGSNVDAISAAIRSGGAVEGERNYTMEHVIPILKRYLKGGEMFVAISYCYVHVHCA
jgi:hypothetical protein